MTVTHAWQYHNGCDSNYCFGGCLAVAVTFTVLIQQQQQHGSAWIVDTAGAGGAPDRHPGDR
jgi:hypothetical protein